MTLGDATFRQLSPLYQDRLLSSGRHHNFGGDSTLFDLIGLAMAIYNTLLESTPPESQARRTQGMPKNKPW